MALRAAILVAALLALGATAQSPVKFIDQHTDESSSARDMQHGKVWQSFKAGWDCALLQIDVLAGSAKPCFEMSGTLSVIKGIPDSWNDFGDDTEASSANASIVHQSFRTSCSADGKPIVCSEEGDCLTWQAVPLATSILMKQGEVYSFALKGFYSEDRLSVGRIGVSPDSENHGGKSSLLISPKFKTKFSQYTFRTWVDTKGPENAYQEVQTTSAPVGSGSKDGGSGVGTAGVVVPVLVVLALVAIAVFVVKMRKSWRHERVHILGSKYMVEPINDDAHSIRSEDSDMSMRRPGGQKRPIHVRSGDKDDSYSTWADTVSVHSEALPPRAHLVAVPTPASTPQRSRDEWTWEEGSREGTFDEESNMFSKGFLI